MYEIRVITKLPNTKQSSKGKVKTHKSINRQNQSTTGKFMSDDIVLIYRSRVSLWSYYWCLSLLSAW